MQRKQLFVRTIVSFAIKTPQSVCLKHMDLISHRNYKFVQILSLCTASRNICTPYLCRELVFLNFHPTTWGKMRKQVLTILHPYPLCKIKPFVLYYFTLNLVIIFKVT